MSRLRSDPWFGRPPLDRPGLVILHRDLIYALARPTRDEVKTPHFEVGNGLNTPGECGYLPKIRADLAHKLGDDSREQLKQFFKEHPEVTSWTPVELRPEEEDLHLDYWRRKYEIKRKLDILWHKIPMRARLINIEDPELSQVVGNFKKTQSVEEVYGKSYSPLNWLPDDSTPVQFKEPMPNRKLTEEDFKLNDRRDDSDPLADIYALQARMDAMTQVVESLQSTLRSNVRLTDSVKQFILSSHELLENAWVVIEKAGNRRIQWGGEAEEWKQAARLFRDHYLQHRMVHGEFVKEWLLPDGVGIDVVEPKPPYQPPFVGDLRTPDDDEWGTR